MCICRSKSWDRKLIINLTIVSLLKMYYMRKTLLIEQQLIKKFAMFKLQFNIKTSWMYNVGFNWDGHILITTYLQWMLLLFIDYQTLLYLPVAYSVLTWHPFFAIEYIFEPEILGYEFIHNNINLMTYCMRWSQKLIMLILDM